MMNRPSNIPQHHRDLYDAEYVAAHCPPSDYDSDTNLDTTVGTWSTNYIIAGVGLLGCLYFYYFGVVRRREGGEKQRRKLWIALYFGGTGLGYGIAGVAHQLYDSKDAKSIVWDLSAHLCNALGLLALQFYVVLPLFERLFRVGVSVLCLAFLGVAWALQSQAIMAIYVLVVLLGMGFYFFSWKQRDWMASLGCLVYMTGLLVQLILAGRCGSKAYEENCFAHCPLPDPMTFNHNALFHVMVIVALIIQLFGRYTPPVINVEEEVQQSRGSTLPK